MESPTSRSPAGADIAPYQAFGITEATLPNEVERGVASAHLSSTLAELGRLCERFGDPDLAEEARAAREPVEQNLLRMVALGQFKRGKSTLVNALLGIPLLPTGVAPVTSVATLVRWAPEPCLEVRHEDGSLEEVELDRLADFVVDGRNPGNAREVRLVEVGYPAELLESGLVLVDTPGIGSTDRVSTERAYDFLPSVDAGLVVLSPDPPVGEAEVSYIRELSTLTPHLLFILNKVDRVSEAEWREALTFNRRVLADALDRDPEEVEIIPASARSALEDGAASMAAVRERIEWFVARRGARVRDELAERRLRSVGAKLEARLAMEARALEMETRELDDRIGELRATLGGLGRRTERAVRSVMATVDDIVTAAGDTLLSELRTKSGGVAQGLRRMVAEASARESNTAVAEHFDRVLRTAMGHELDAWWDRHGPEVTRSLLGEMDRAGRDLVEARRQASAWILETFGVPLPEEPQVGALKESRDFYRSVEGVTPRITVDLLRTLLPRRLYRAWLRRRAGPVAAEALEMGAGQVRGDLLYRARETARAFTSQLRVWTLAGTDGLTDALARAATLRANAERDVAQRYQELGAMSDDLDALMERMTAVPASGDARFEARSDQVAGGELR